MIYVLRYTGPYEVDNFLEHTYDEGAISVRNRIALVQYEHNKDKFLRLGQYEFLGTIEKETDLPKLLEHDDKLELSLGIKGEKVPLERVLTDPKYQDVDKDEEQTSWYKNLQ